MRLSECVFYTGIKKSDIFPEPLLAREALDELFTHSDHDSAVFSSELQAFGITLPEPPLRVVTICPGMTDEPFSMKTVIDFARETADFLQANLRHNGIFYYINSRIQGIVQVRDAGELKDLYAVLRAYQKNDDDPHMPCMAISGSCDSVGAISHGCKENEEARVFGRFLDRNFGIIVQHQDFFLYYPDAQEYQRDDDEFFGEMSQKICSCMIVGDRERMHQALDKVLNYMISRFPQVSGVHMRAIHFCKPLEMTLVGADLIDRVFVQKFRLVQRVIENENERDLRQAFHDSMDAIWDYAQQRKSRNHQEIMHHITEYIDCNLGDPELSISSIAEKFHMHPTKLSAQFREYYQDTIPNVINKKRITYIKQQMRSTNLTVKEIALNAGYVSLATMNRVFLKLEGMYPGQYRKQYENQSGE